MPDLSPHLHTEECNKLIKLLHSCYSGKQFGKFFGTCNSFQVEVDKCLKGERQNNRANNLEAARRRKEEILSRMNQF